MTWSRCASRYSTSMQESHDFVPTDREGGLILATRLPGDPDELGDARRGWNDLDPPAEGPPLWIHLDRKRDRARRWIEEEAGLDPLVASSLLAEETRPCFQAYGDGLLVILRGVNMNPGAEPDELIAIRLWLEPLRVITLRQFRFQTLAELRRLAQQGKAPNSSGAFLAAVGLMVAGWDDSEVDLPGFPKDGSWTIRVEGMQRMP